MGHLRPTANTSSTARAPAALASRLSRPSPASRRRTPRFARKGPAPCRAAPSPSAAPESEKDADAVVDELKQLKQEKLERAGKYRSKVAGTETPEWNFARVVERNDLLPKMRELILEVETSRELVSLRNSYCAVGKVCQLKVKGSEPMELTPSCAPFPPEDQHGTLLKLRGDLRAGQTKLPEDVISVKALLSVLVTPEDGEAFDLQPEAPDLAEDKLSAEVGPFLGAGFCFRGPIQSVFNYPTLLICCEGKGIGFAKAMVEATAGRGSLDLACRDDVRVYYKVPNEDSVCYGDLFASWEEEYGVKTIVHTSSFLDAFDDDDDLEYEPETTAMVSLGDVETEKAACELCEEAEIKVHIKSSEQQQDMHYADTGRVV